MTEKACSRESAVAAKSSAGRSRVSPMPDASRDQRRTSLACPANAYDVNIKIEEHAFETYSKYLIDNPNDQKIKEIAQDELNHVKELNEALSLLTTVQINAEKSISNIEIITKEDINPRLINNET